MAQEAIVDRFLVPRLGFVVVIGLATLLIGVVVRGPDTNGNLWNDAPPGYARTEVTVVGGKGVEEGRQAGTASPGPRVALALPEVALGDVEPMSPGRRVYIQAGCATCHGVDALGGPVGPSLAASHPEIVKRMVRDGPGGMPAYSATSLSDADLDKLAVYLRGLETAPKPGTEELARLQRIAYDPLVPVDVLLKGKAALRRSCGACHAQPTNEEIVAAFSTDAEVSSLVATMVRETNLSLEDAKLITYYMLAIRNGADPLRRRDSLRE